MIKKLSSRKIIRLIAGGALLFYAMSGISSVLNYALYPVLSRILPIQDYGETQFLLSISNQLSFGFVVLNILAIIITASAQSAKEKSDTTRSLTIVAGAVSLVVSLIGTALLIIFAGTLQLNSPLAITLLAVSFILNVPFTTLLGRLQGDGKFIASGVVSFAATIGKFAFSILFVSIGFGVTGVMAGIVCGMIAALLVGVLYTGRPRRQMRTSFYQHTRKLTHIRGQALASAIAILAITFLSGADLLASRILLDSTDAGLYSVIATLAKITIAACSPLVWLALPGAAKKDRSSVRRFMYISVGVCAVFITPLFIAPLEITKIFMSVDPGIYSSLLPFLALSMSTYAIAFVTMSSVIAMNALRAAYGSVVVSSVVFIGITTILFVFNGNVSINDIVIAQFIAGIMLLLANTFTLSLREKNIRV